MTPDTDRTVEYVREPVGPKTAERDSGGVRAGAEPALQENRGRRHAQVAFAALVLYMVVAVPVVLFSLGTRYWFYSDEWGLLAGRSVTNLGELFRPQNGHWSTLPIVVFRGLYAVFGVHSYKPYQLATLLLHLTLVMLIWLVMRRAGVRPWLATIVAAVFVLYGPGHQNIVLAVQVSMVASLVLGFGQVVLADHDGDINRRDWLGLGCGALGLMSSAVGPIMVAVVGLATLLRRGWRASLFQTVPLVALFGVWYGFEHAEISKSYPGRPPVSVVIRWVVTGEGSVFSALGYFRLLAIILGLVFVAGIALIVRSTSLRDCRRRFAAPLALLLGSPLLFATVSVQRWWLGIGQVHQSHYLGLATALTLPALGVAFEALVGQWRAVAPFLVALLLVPVPWNIAHFNGTEFPAAYYGHQKRLVLGVAFSPAAEDVPRSERPFPDPLLGAPTMTVGFLLDARRAGKLGEAPTLDAVDKAAVRSILGVEQSSRPLPKRLVCEVRTWPVELRPTPGAQFGFRGPVNLVDTSTGIRSIRRLDPSNGTVLTIRLANLHLSVEPSPGSRIQVCS